MANIRTRIRNYNRIERPSKDILNKYIQEGKKQKDIANLYNCSKSLVGNWLRFYNIECPKGPKKYYANEEYFNTWSHNMAYCLGFIAADGHIWKTRFKNSKNDYYYSNIVSASYDILKNIQDKLKFGILTFIKSKYWEIKFSQSASKKLYKIMYNNEEFCLKRKKEKFQRIKNAK